MVYLHIKIFKSKIYWSGCILQVRSWNSYQCEDTLLVEITYIRKLTFFTARLCLQEYVKARFLGSTRRGFGHANATFISASTKWGEIMSKKKVYDKMEGSAWLHTYHNSVSQSQATKDKAF